MQPRQPPAAALRLAMLRICQQNGVAYAETAALDGLSGAASCFLQDLAWHARHHAELANRSKVVRTDAAEAARGVLPVRLGKNSQGVAEAWEEDEEETAGWVNPVCPGREGYRKASNRCPRARNDADVGEDDPSADDNPVVLQFEIEQIGAPRWNLQTSPSQSVQEQPRHSQSASAPSSCSRRTCPDEPQMATATHMFGDGAEAAHLRRSRTSPELDAKLLSRSEFCFDFELHSVARCISCKAEGGELFLSPCDQQQYCKWCWIAADFNESGAPPSKWQPWPLIAVQVVCVWHAEELAAAWSGRELPRIPQAPQASCNAVSAPEATSEPAPSKVDIVSIIPIHLQPDMVGPLARECLQWRAQPGQLIQDRFRILRHLGRGSYTEAYLAEDVMGARKVCLKRHHMFDVEVLADLVVIDQRLHEVDPEGSAFPRLLEAFFDGLGWTVESLVEGLDLQVKSAVDPSFFEKVPRLKLVARGVLGGLALLEEAGIVHNDLKPDNIVWVEGPSGTSTVRIIDFNCARLDNRQSPGQNWNVREGGIGCRAYCSPEMALGLPVTHSSDVWSLAVVLTELYSRRPSSLVLCCDHEAVQVSIAQALGLCNMAEGIPSSFLLKSPLTLNRNFTPAFTTVRGHLPLRQNQNADMEALRPVQFGLGHVFGSKTDDEANLLRDFLEVCLVWDGLHRPTAKKLLTRSGFLGRGAAKASSVKRAAKPP
ncbi:HIPK4 [Symbiodinium sp. KB8]|nr:HIPK4 [Symbiodinium sp. KB8]